MLFYLDCMKVCRDVADGRRFGGPPAGPDRGLVSCFYVRRIA